MNAGARLSAIVVPLPGEFIERSLTYTWIGCELLRAPREANRKAPYVLHAYVPRRIVSAMLGFSPCINLLLLHAVRKQIAKITNGSVK